MKTLLQPIGQEFLVVGVDEAGRGPLAGPVVAAAVILDANHTIIGLTDSKKLSEKQRNSLFEEIYKTARAVATGRADVNEIDKINILQASLLAMQRAVEALSIIPQHALIDGNHCPKLRCSVEAVIKGDLHVPCISAASIIAKVTRDREMVNCDKQYPGYGFAQHKGYGTKQHLAALRELGPCAVHRRTYQPVQQMCMVLG